MKKNDLLVVIGQMRQPFYGIRKAFHSNSIVLAFQEDYNKMSVYSNGKFYLILPLAIGYEEVAH